MLIFLLFPNLVKVKGNTTGYIYGTKSKRSTLRQTASSLWHKKVNATGVFFGTSHESQKTAYAPKPMLAGYPASIMREPQYFFRHAKVNDVSRGGFSSSPTPSGATVSDGTTTPTSPVRSLRWWRNRCAANASTHAIPCPPDPTRAPSATAVVWVAAT